MSTMFPIRVRRFHRVALCLWAGTLLCCQVTRHPEATGGPADPGTSTDNGTGISTVPATGGSGGSGSGAGTAAPGASGCQPMRIEGAFNLGGYACDRFTWSDAGCKTRTASLVKNSAADPGGSRGGYLRQITYEANGQPRTVNGSGANGWNGWGYIVNHYASTASTSRTASGGSLRTLLAGAHHAIHEFKVRVNPGAAVDTTVHWYFATGRSHPIYAITFDATPAGADKVQADTRAPYGDMIFDGGSDNRGDVSGIGWGDRYRFETQGKGPVTWASTWDYREPNTVPYVVAWSEPADAEMGAVQTQTFDQQIAGGDYGAGMLSACQGKDSSTAGQGCTSGNQTLPQSWLWPFQLNQYELDYVTTSKRVAWGSTYGAVGQRSYTAFGQTHSGYPLLSYSVYGVFGPHAESAVEAQRKEVEAVQKTQLVATVGTVLTRGPAGAGRSDEIAFAPPGYNPVYGVWDLAAASNRAAFRIAVGATPLSNPTFRLLGYSAERAPAVRLDGSALQADQDYFLSLETANQLVWITLNRTLTGQVEVAIE